MRVCTHLLQPRTVVRWSALARIPPPDHRRQSASRCQHTKDWGGLAGIDRNCNRSNTHFSSSRPIGTPHASNSQREREMETNLSNDSGIVTVTEKHVRAELEASGNDSSHDWWHIVRVRNLALRLAKDEGLAKDRLEVVQLAALLHDLHDWKYSGSATAGAEAATTFLVGQAYDPVKIELVVSVIRRIGFKDELSGNSEPLFPELAVVQDADRLDAIGAIGIARCLTYGGHFNRVLHDPAIQARDALTKEQYTDKTVKQTTVNHFPEKLLKLKDMMKTESGKRMAEGRHKVMVDYLANFFSEWEGTS